MAKYTWRKPQNEIRKILAFGMTGKELAVIGLSILIGIASYFLLKPIVGKNLVVYISFGAAFMIGYGILGRYQNMNLFELIKRKYMRPAVRHYTFVCDGVRKEREAKRNADRNHSRRIKKSSGKLS